MPIRKCGYDDWPLLQTFGREVFLATFGAVNKPENIQAYIEKAFHKNTIVAELSHPDSEFWLATENDEVAGYLKINFREAQTEPVGPQGMEIQRIYVAENFQGKGVAQALMTKARARAEDAGMDFIWLGVWEHNPRAIRFYEKNGFEAFGTHVFHMGDEAQTDIMMQLKIKP
jgi:ribosomal protein S18 acetylase RimI-like enzyme